jgi:hypothetical protein
MWFISNASISNIIEGTAKIIIEMYTLNQMLGNVSVMWYLRGIIGAVFIVARQQRRFIIKGMPE